MNKSNNKRMKTLILFTPFLYTLFNKYGTGYIYVKVSELQAIHQSNLRATLSKVLHRSFGYNGIFYGIPLCVYVTSAMFRFPSQLFKCKRESLIYFINLIGSIFSFAKTMKLIGLCRERA